MPWQASSVVLIVQAKNDFGPGLLGALTTVVIRILIAKGEKHLRFELADGFIERGIVFLSNEVVP